MFSEVFVCPQGEGVSQHALGQGVYIPACAWLGSGKWVVVKGRCGEGVGVVKWGCGERGCRKGLW